MFKKGEDYIALYSQKKTQALVSIYQRRIIDKYGRTDSGIATRINNLVNMRRKSAKSQRKPKGDGSNLLEQNGDESKRFKTNTLVNPSGVNTMDNSMDAGLVPSGH